MGCSCCGTACWGSLIFRGAETSCYSVGYLAPGSKQPTCFSLANIASSALWPLVGDLSFPFMFVCHREAVVLGLKVRIVWGCYICAVDAEPCGCSYLLLDAAAELCRVLCVLLGQDVPQHENKLPRSLLPHSIIVVALDEIHSNAVLRLLVFFSVKSHLELVRLWRETSRHQHRRHPSRRGLAQTERLFFLLGKPRIQGPRFALVRLIVKYGYYIAGQRGMPVQQYDVTAGAGCPIPQQPLIGCGLPGPCGGNVYGKARLPISVYRRMPPLTSKKSPRLTAPFPSGDGSRKPARPYVRKYSLPVRSTLS